jgi:small nuclear ribonucleoprotein (snRNP)-like protein
MAEQEMWNKYVGETVIVDSDSQFVYIGTLKEVLDNFLLMENVDVHDRNEGPSTKEQYIMDVKNHGVNANRKEVSVRKSLVVSLSKLDDVITY